MLEMNYQFKENENKGVSFDLFKAFAIVSSLTYIFFLSPRYILPTIEFHYANFVVDKNKYDDLTNIGTLFDCKAGINLARITIFIAISIVNTLYKNNFIDISVEGFIL